ncbi:MAG: DMT family transporter [Clostridiales bacterium]|nr:DMT family transporter [Clostridiales bacterium]MCI6999504.1 DMT family transporter [Clostridiales bacterium]
MSNSRKHTLAVITACIAFVIFGFSFMFSSIALSITSTMVLLCFRFTVAVITLTVVVAVNSLVGRIRGKAWFSFSLRGKPMGGLLLLGIVQPVLYLVFENSSIRYTSSAVTGTVLAVVPVICILADVFISRESVSKLQVVCAVACVAGVALVETGGETRISFLGFFCLLMTLVCDVGYYILSRRASRQFSPLEVTYVMFLMGMIVFVPAALIQGRGQMAELFLPAIQSAPFWGSVVFLGAVSSVGAYGLLNYANATLTNSEASLIGNIATVVSVLAGVLLLRDPFSPLQAIGVVVILIFVTLANLPKRKK